VLTTDKDTFVNFNYVIFDDSLVRIGCVQMPGPTVATVFVATCALGGLSRR
jgi:hypothetical protein